MLGISNWWNDVAPVLAVLAPLVAVHVTIVAIHLRTIRDAQQASRLETTRRFDTLASSLESLRSAVRQFERDYATKEEWLRESMVARQHIDRMSQTLARLESRARTSE